MALATGLYRIGDFVECEKIAQQLIAEATSREHAGSPGSTRWRARSPARAATSTRTRTPRPPPSSGPTASSPPI